MTRSPSLVFAPWTDEQVDSLKQRQRDIWLHPYRCEAGHLLTPTPKGWRHLASKWCPHHWLRPQRWAHALDAGYPWAYRAANIQWDAR